MKDVRILGGDLGKNRCSIVGLDGAGRVLLRRRARREGVIALAAKLPGCVVAMEACCGAHHLGRLLLKQGHEVRLMSPEYVRLYVKARMIATPRRLPRRRPGRRCGSWRSRARRSSTCRFCIACATGWSDSAPR